MRIITSMSVLITGATGMVGRHLKSLNESFVGVGSKDYDLRDPYQADFMLKMFQPKTIIHLAARVGGIKENIKRPVEFFEDNVCINTNILRAAHLNKVERVISILSTCIYPDALSEEYYPLREEYLHLGPPAKSNFSYGYAKRCLAVQTEAYRSQYGCKYSYLIPCNLYSEFDHFEGDKAHFITALIKKIVIAKRDGSKFIELHGSGNPMRQFMHAQDLARAINTVLKSEDTNDYNICPSENLSIRNIAEKALKACDAEDLELRFLNDGLDGQIRKDACNSKFLEAYPSFAFTSLFAGIHQAYYATKDKLAAQ